MKAAIVLKNVSRAIIMLFAVLAALLQLNVADDLVKILFTGVIAMIALAGGLAFGLGSKNFVEDLLVEVKKNGNKKACDGY